MLDGIDLAIIDDQLARSEEEAVFRLRSEGIVPYFFGLGFVQLKVTDKIRYHFYHPDFDGFIENPHDHRYSFISNVLKGTLENHVWEESSWNESSSTCTVKYTACLPEGEAENVPDPYPIFMNHIGVCIIHAGSSYYMHHDAFHRVKPATSPCITRVTRQSHLKDKPLARFIAKRDEACPFSDLKTEEAWEMIRECVVRPVSEAKRPERNKK